MKGIGAPALVAALILLPQPAPAQETIEQVIKEFGPLVSTVRGAVRSLVDRGRGAPLAANKP